MMERRRLIEILDRFGDVTILVLGDYFLDKYLDIDRSLAETSLETGLEAHQVVNVRTSPGAAGNVAANLVGLGVRVVALGILGDDGNGYDLIKCLEGGGVVSTPLIRTTERFTPTYTKPMMHQSDGRVHELSRLDISNRTPTSPALEDTLIERLRHLVPVVDGIVIADQVPARNCGVVTDRVREALISLAAEHPDKTFIADSRLRIGEYRNITLKPNDREALAAVGCAPDDEHDIADVITAGLALNTRCGRPVIVTVGKMGALAFANQDHVQVRAVPVQGPIDIVGAGDSALAGITAALSVGATLAEATLLGNLVASVTIQCIGTTGTASQEQVLEALQAWQAANQASD